MLIAAYRLVLLGNGPLDFIAVSPLVTIVLGSGALYGFGRMLRDLVAVGSRAWGKPPGGWPAAPEGAYRTSKPAVGDEPGHGPGQEAG